ncbi:hypothetical protein J5N97_012656 [Dioscorea zingiberensis]|uniref:Uncharacterized protein n=1 Tax=Dioscorea zingiberensis TaxID=325984 RepID=A0A9D5CQR2_9LILI|nr:hypothetical protein J5N97_012656 [Dioscorea zingiberensis]
MVIRHNIGTESDSQFYEGIGFRTESSHTNLESNAMLLNSLHVGISQAISGNDIDGISLLNEGGNQTIEMQNKLGKQKLNIQEDTLMGKQSSLLLDQFPTLNNFESLSGAINLMYPFRTGSASVSPRVPWAQLPYENKVQTLSRAAYHTRATFSRDAWGQLPSTLSGGVKHTHPLPTQIASPPVAWHQLPSSIKIQTLHGTVNHNFPSVDTGAKLKAIESYGGTSLSSDAPYQTQCFENILSQVGFSKSAESNIVDGKCHKFNEDEANNGKMGIEVLNPVKKVTSKVLPRQSMSGTIPSKNESEVGHPSKKASNVARSDKQNIDQRELIAAANAARNASHVACSNSFWKRVEPLFSSVNQKDIDDMTQRASTIYCF